MVSQRLTNAQKERGANVDLWPGPRVGAPRTRSVTQVYVGFLGSRGGHAAVSHFWGAKSMAVFLNATAVYDCIALGEQQTSLTLFSLLNR